VCSYSCVSQRGVWCVEEKPLICVRVLYVYVCMYTCVYVYAIKNEACGVYMLKNAVDLCSFAEFEGVYSMCVCMYIYIYIYVCV